MKVLLPNLWLLQNIVVVYRKVELMVIVLCKKNYVFNNNLMLYSNFGVKRITIVIWIQPHT